ncbi:MULTISPECIES: multicopper oxidase family protein [Actinomadura]|uniref:Multicopper oxidase CueO n=1 Tax=Actinomadura yumaensis TaxID=111807 RepID=A0ABW2CNM9_9ACTN|nr:multicopper oxidase family protein [Actinomadura sp. J1-007]MWK36683.1 multicopper oxidase domain-containing protein [Actinomadura sp. J1-007]
MLGRRDALKLSAAGAAGIAVPGVLGARSLRRAFAAGPAAPAFTRPLALPRVLRPVRRTMTTDYYEMAVREAETEILPGVKTRVVAYDGSFPGPTIRALKGRRVVVRQSNDLDMDVSTHLHGGHVSPGDDGHPAFPVAPGDARDYTYPNAQPAATLWYHDHVHHMEAEMVFRGLSGLYVIDDPMEWALGLPNGAYDVPIVMRDIHLDDAGQIVWEMGDFQNRNTILVNGRTQPYFEVAARKYRLRLVNGSNMRFFNLSLSNGGDLTVIGGDGGLLPAPQTVKSVQLSAGERADVVVDFGAYEPGTRIVLTNAFGTDAATREIMRFDVGSPVRDRSRVPDRLGRTLALPDADVTRDVVMDFNPATNEWTMDGRAFDMNRVDIKIKRGQTEIWRVKSDSTHLPVPHNIHLHGTHFEVLDRDGRPPAPHETGPKDTVAVMAGSTVRIKVRYDRYLGRYLYHCHLLDHSAMGMMAQAEIVA